MSWMKRAQGSAPREPPQYPAPQPAINQQGIYPNYAGTTANSQQQQQQQQYWQYNQQQFPQQYAQTQQYPTTEYANANQFYQQPQQYNQNYTNQAFQQGYQQNYYQNPGGQQNFQKKSDGWEDNWDWGWEDSSKQGHNAGQNPLQQPPAQTQPVFNNANVIEESFTSTDTWNWATEDKKETTEKLPPAPTQQTEDIPVLENKTLPPTSTPENTSPGPPPPTSEEIRTLNDREVVKDRLPNLALGKRFHLENLTPQWSIESQMSQESSDGPHTHSESTYRSDNQSRNSSKDSPGITDNSNFNFSQQGTDELQHNSEWSRNSDEATLMDNLKSGRESHDDLTKSIQDMNIANCENPTPDNVQLSQVPEVIKQENILEPEAHSMLLPNVSTHIAATQPLTNLPQMPPSQSPHPQVLLPPPVTPAPVLPPPPGTSSIPPPTFPPQSSSTNPFKHSGPFSHKSTSKSSSNTFPPAMTSSSQGFSPQISSSSLVSPSAVNKVSQHSRTSINYGANLETTPDNSERPDQMPVTNFRPNTMPQQVPENLEVAPQNDRNEYLQTAHLSSGDYGENTDFSRNIPPPGLRRMVLGQQESEYNQNLNMSGDEPPPGLARMVPGQQNEGDNDNVYVQQNEGYMDRHIDGQPTDSTSYRQADYRQADGQQTPDNYAQPSATRSSDRRPIGLDRMVPGEPSNDEYPQYQASNYSSNEQRVVTGVDHDYPITADVGPSNIREQNMDGSDYTDHVPRIPSRNVVSSEMNEEQQREVTMEGENLQDLSVISSTELTLSREQILDGADLDSNLVSLVSLKTDASESLEHTSSRRQSINRVTSGEDSERDRAFKASPRRDRESKHKSSRDRESRYSREDRKYDRDDRRSTRDDRRSDKDDRRSRQREDSPDRRHRRSARSHRYETEDTDYCSDRERDRRRYREGSYTSKPPRPDDKDRHYRDDRDRNRRYNTIERERRYHDDRDGETRSRRSDRDRDRDRYEKKYRDIDPTRKYGNLKREEEERRRGEYTSRADSREAGPTDDELNGSHERRHHRRRRDPDPYYDGYGAGMYGDPYLLQRQQYQYYEQLRRTDPAAYMRVYKQIMATHAQQPDWAAKMYEQGYGYEPREERGSVHSGRSSANGLKGTDPYYPYGRMDTSSLRDAASLRTDLSDRDLNTDASLNLHLEESTVRSERMTPFKFSTAHIKGTVSSRHVVVVRPSYPVDGLPATVHVLSLSAALANDAHAQELDAFPGPLVKGVTHKKSVVEYCGARARAARGPDRLGRALVWHLLALLLRQNGVVVGSDIAELLMKDKQENEFRPIARPSNNLSGGGSSASGEERGTPDPPSASLSDLTPQEDSMSQQQTAYDEKAVVDKFREYLTYGNRTEALEYAMSNRLWGHALTLALYSDRRARAAVSARFLAALPPADPLHTLYATLANKQPPQCAVDSRTGDWRAHVAIVLSNPSARPEHDRRTLTHFGDSLAARGLIYSAQFCYVSAGLPFSRHPAAPYGGGTGGEGKLTLLLADPKATTLAQLATNDAIFATEIYEYAMSLNQDYVIPELQVYKLVMACRLSDAGRYERALGYTERASAALTSRPHHYPPALAGALATLADRLKYHDPALAEDPPLLDEGESAEPSPRHQAWIDDVKMVANTLADASLHSTPQHNYYQQQQHHQQQQWTDQNQPTYIQPTYNTEADETLDYSYYQQPVPTLPTIPTMPQQVQPIPTLAQPRAQPPTNQVAEEYNQYEEWPREEQVQNYADPYWQGDQYSYGEGGAGTGGAEEARPMITMPGGNHQPLYNDMDDDRPPSTEQTDRETDTPKSSKKDAKPKEDANKGKSSGWLGGFLNKLSLRPPNQMILPDDKNPTIVWDKENKRWKNLDADEDEGSTPPPPPPTMTELTSKLPPSPLQPTAGVPPPMAPTSNLLDTP